MKQSMKVLLASICVSCGHGGRNSPQDSAPDILAAKESTSRPHSEGLTIVLSEGTPPQHKTATAQLVASKPLPADRTRALLARLPPLEGEDEDEKPFALRGGSKPAPKTGHTVRDTFPPTKHEARPPTTHGARPPSATGGALRVLRFAPEGAVPVAPQLSVTFSEPMVAVSSQKQAQSHVPVRLSPQPAGQFRWIGTRTLLFDPKVRMPMATRYEVQVPEGTRSASGHTLRAAKRWFFQTPAPTLQAQWPAAQPARRLTPIFLQFDQRIDAREMAKSIFLRANGKAWKVRLATAKEIAANEEVSRLVEHARAQREGRYMVVQPVTQLPADAAVTVVVRKGAPSAEGPRRTQKEQRFSFRTYAPLHVVKSRCGWRSTCRPGMPWEVRFNNPLDDTGLDTSRIAIRPALPARSIEIVGNHMLVRGQAKGETTYQIRVPGALQDTFGQRLGKDKTLTFKVGPARPTLSGPTGLVVLDPTAAKPVFGVYSTRYRALDVQAFRVTPTDWSAFRGYQERAARQRTFLKPPFPRVMHHVVKVAGDPQQLVETTLDLTRALGGKLGHLYLVIKPADEPEDVAVSRATPRVQAWVQSTRVGLDAFVDNNQLYAWSTQLRSGKALRSTADLDLKLVSAGLSLQPTRTAGSGIATFALPTGPRKGSAFLLVSKGKDRAFLPEHDAWWSRESNWTRHPVREELRWYIFDDRQMYRPGEQVRLKGWLRRLDPGLHGDVMPLDGQVSSLTYRVRDSRGNLFAEGSTRVNRFGGFDLTVALPKDLSLGHTSVELTASGDMAHRSMHHAFQVQEFRRPEFEVSTSASQGPHMVGRPAAVTLHASYFAGGPLPQAKTRWEVVSLRGSFDPPGHDDYAFGEWRPWWDYAGAASGMAASGMAASGMAGGLGVVGRSGRVSRPNMDEGHVQQLEGLTDARGRHTLALDFASVNPPRATRVTVHGTVTDVNRQAWSSSETLLVHPSAHYVGLKTEKMFFDRKAPMRVSAVVVDHDGKLLSQRSIAMRAVRLDWTFRRGELTEVEKNPQLCRTTSSTSTPDAATCTFRTEVGGTYRITARVRDAQGRANETVIQRWVAGGKLPAQRGVELEDVVLIPDKETYRPGEKARVLVQAPFYPAEGVVTWQRSGIEHIARFRMKGPTHTLEVPLSDRHTPNLQIQVNLNGTATRRRDDGMPDPKLPARPAFAQGNVMLKIPPQRRVIQVEVKPAQRAVEPGSETKVAVALSNAAGEPLGGAEVAAVVVDEAVLSLSQYALPDPVESFYSDRPGGVREHHLRSWITLARPEAGDATEEDQSTAQFSRRELISQEAAPRASRAFGGSAADHVPGPIVVRKNFDALALFAPSVVTNAAGHATLNVKVPDNLTRYRIMVVATDGARAFGKGESSLTARLPLMVRPSPPRFLNIGDRFELPVVLQNQTGDAMQVDVAVRGRNLELKSSGKRLQIPAHDRVEVRFAAAARLPGTARLQVATSAARFADAATASWPVWTPATTEAFATYGVVEDGVMRQPVAVPPEAEPRYGDLSITTSSTQLQSLTDAFLYLMEYPFASSEQMASRVLAVAALRDVLQAFSVEDLPSPRELEQVVAKDLKQLSALQNPDGGFAFWRRGDPSWPFVSIHVAHAFARAREKEFQVPDEAVSRSLAYLRTIRTHIPASYPREAQWALRAYALAVRRRLGEDVAKDGRALVAEAQPGKLPLEAAGWLLSALEGDGASAAQRTAIHRHLENKVSETAAGAHFVTSYGDGEHLMLHSDRRVDGVVLEALIANRPESDLIVKLVRGLLAHKQRGRWSNTQDNVFALLALDTYFQTYEKSAPNFVARVWLGEQHAGSHPFRGRNVASEQLTIPLSYLAEHQPKAALTLQKQGTGRLYYRVGMTYAPKSLRLESADHGFAVSRRYHAVDEPSDVRRDDSGTWHIKSGARVRVELVMVATSRRYHVALVDPMAAGLEPMNAALSVTGPLPTSDADPKPHTWWRRTWYEHQNLRDERAEAFTSLLWEGVHRYEYYVRASTPGTFVVPSTKAEEMYHPETFGRSSTDRIVID